MATFLQIGLLENFGVVFVVLIVFLILFGLLEYMKAFGEGKRSLHAIISFAVALLFIVSKTATAMVTMMVPWFMVFAIFIFFTMFLVRIFGLKEKNMISLIGSKDVYPWIIVIIILILLFSLGNAMGQGLLERGEGTGTPTNMSGGQINPSLQPAVTGTRSTTTNSFTTNMLNTLRHPQVMGMLFVFLVGMFALIFLTKAAKP